MGNIDLHMHSTCSDGNYTPSELVGYAKTVEEALANYLHQGGLAYVEYNNPSFSEVAKQIHETSGLVSLAHPAEYGLSCLETEELVQVLIENGLDGIECIHPSQNHVYSNQMMKIAKKNHLKITGGSDFHGRKEEDIDLGVGGENMVIPEEFFHSSIQKIIYNYAH